ncbi:hypothetical protein D3C87_1973160 [compost metagenome]
MVDPLTIVIPCVLMGIEVNEGEGAVLFCMGLQKRPGDKMIAAQRQQEGTGGDDL